MNVSNLIQHWIPGRVYKRLVYVALVWLCAGFVLLTLHSNISIVNRPVPGPGKVQTKFGSNIYYEYLDANSMQHLKSPPLPGEEKLNAVRGLLQKDYSSNAFANSLAKDLGSVGLVQNAVSISAEQNNLAENSDLDEPMRGKLMNDGVEFGDAELGSAHGSAAKRKSVAQLIPHVDTVESVGEPQIVANLAQLTRLGWSAAVSANTNPYTNRNHNLPVADWPRAKLWRAKSSKSSRCAISYPDLYELHFNNVFWQVLRGLAPIQPAAAQPAAAQSGAAPKAKSTAAPSAAPSAAPASDEAHSSSQQFKLQPVSYYLYNAYYDDRVRGGPSPYVRVLAMVDRIRPPPVNCFLWYANLSQPVITAAIYTYAWYPKWGNYHDGQLQPFIISCKLPKSQSKLGPPAAPDSVSLSLNQCSKPMNNLRVINERPQVKKSFAVCVKGLDFLYEDLSVRLVEWIELLNLLGAEKIFLYELEMHPNISKVLAHYVDKGFVELTKLSLPGEQPNIPGFRHLYLKNKLTNKRQNELIPYNDCLYRNLYSYKYLALLDIDEVIMPLKHANWRQLMEQVERLSLSVHNYSRASYNVRNAYFLDDLTKLGGPDEQAKRVAEQSGGRRQSNRTRLGAPQSDQSGEPGVPRYMHMLSHVVRSRNYTKPNQYVKCFHNTERVVSLHNHFPMNCFGTCTSFPIDTSLAHLQHYRKDCVGPLRNACNKDFRSHTVRDTTIWRYKDALIERATQTLIALGFFA